MKGYVMYPLGKPRKYRPGAVYCGRSNTSATASEKTETAVIDGANLLGWKCPGCGRVVKLCKYDKEYSVFVGQRWPKHYTTQRNLGDKSL